MAEQVRAYEVQIKGANSVKELKQEISALRDKLVGLDTSTKEYSDTVEDLIADEKKLKEVMSAGKDSITGAAGSYNALVAEMGALKKVWREVADEGKRNEIGARIAEINNELKSMDSSIGNFQRNVGDYENAIRQALLTPQQELKKLKTELAGLEEGTDEYNQTFQRMAQLTHDVAEQTEQLRWSSADLGDILGNIAGVAQGVAGGFSAISAVQGLIGQGNEDVEQAMLTTQRWIQLIQGLGAIEELGDRIKGLWTGLKQFTKETNSANAAMNTLNASSSKAGVAIGGLSGGLKKAIVSVKALSVSIKTALISSGIGLLIVALGTAVSWLWKFVDGSAKAEKITEEQAKATDKLNKTLETHTESLDREVAILEAEGASYEKIYQAKKKSLQASLAEINTELAKQQAIAKSIGQKKLESDAYKDFNDKLKELVELQKEYQKQIDDLDFDRNEIQPRKKATEAVKKQKEAEAELSKQREEDYNKQQDLAKDLYEDLVSYYKNDTQKRKEEYQRQLKLIEQWNTSVENKEKAQYLLKKQYAEKEYEVTLEKEREKYDRIREYREKQIELFGIDTRKGLEAQKKEYENFKAYLEDFYDAMKKYSKTESEEFIKKQLNEFNTKEGTDFKFFGDGDIDYLSEIQLELDIVTKKIKETDDALVELVNNDITTVLGNRLKFLGLVVLEELEKFDLNLEKMSSTSNKYIKGWYSGISPNEAKTQLEERYKLLEKYALKEIEMYDDALEEWDEVNEELKLKGEERYKVEEMRYDAVLKYENILTQKIIDSNYLQIESFELLADSMIGISQSIGDVFSSVSDMIMDSAESQLEAGEITQEEYERQFEKAKAFQTAQAIINTIAGAVGAFMGITKDTGGWGIALAIAQATAVFASGMAQVKKIQETEPKKGGGGSESVRFAEVTPSATSDFRPELTQNATGSQETENLANALSKNPIKAYVVESDISSAQSKAQQRTKESTF